MNITHGPLMIREAVPDDAAQLCQWWNDGSVMAHAGFPNGLGTTEEAVRSRMTADPRRHLHIICHQSIPIGEMHYREISSDVCEIGVKICDPAMQNRGFGKTLLSLFIRALLDDCRFSTINLDTNLDNLRAQHVYEQLGFVRLRVNRDSWQDQLGRWQSSVDYELTRETFMPHL